MAAGGKRQGAGRKPGLPNKRSELRIERALREGRRLPPESLLLIADQQLAMVEYYQPVRHAHHPAGFCRFAL
jgi:hypothetical protein